MSMLARDNIQKANNNLCPIYPRSGIYARYIKRLLDILISLLAITIIFPINIVLAVLTYMDVGSPIF